MEKYELEKKIWTDADFEIMGWHDSQIWAMGFHPEIPTFILDIDYIFEWADPLPGKTSWSHFWVSPCTLVFEDWVDHKCNLDLNHNISAEIMDIHRNITKYYENGEPDWLYTIETNLGEIHIDASKYTQFVRKDPILNHGQILDLSVRGGINLDVPPF